MALAEESMATVFRASYVSLHVRKSNRAALSLYRDTLGFTVKDIEKKYCACSQLLLQLVLTVGHRCRWGRRICYAAVPEGTRAMTSCTIECTYILIHTIVYMANAGCSKVGWYTTTADPLPFERSAATPARVLRHPRGALSQRGSLLLLLLQPSRHQRPSY